MSALHDLEAARRFEQPWQLGDVRRAIACVRMARAIPRRAARDELRVREEEPERCPLFVGCEEPARVIEVQMREHDHVDIFV